MERGQSVKWEDLGGQQNRILDLEGRAIQGGPRSLDQDRFYQVFIFVSVPGQGEDDQTVLLPVVRFAEPGGGESDHTARFYQGVCGFVGASFSDARLVHAVDPSVLVEASRTLQVKERGEISIRKILSQLYVGSCPRNRSHIDQLHSLGISVVVNFQTEEDCKRNCVSGIGMEEDPLAVSRVYDSKGMQYIWMPTFDMSSDGRAQMLPQASFLFGQLIRRGHTVYSHCNAGVGRSVAAACGYLTFFLGLSQRQMHHVMASSRPVAYFDFEALERARPRFQALFAGEETAEADSKCKDALDSLGHDSGMRGPRLPRKLLTRRRQPAKCGASSHAVQDQALELL